MAQINTFDGAERPPRIRKPFIVRWRWPLLAACTIAAVAGVLWSARHETRTIVIVAPFENETNDSAFTLVATAAGSWISDGLARAQLVDVIDFQVALEQRANRGTATAIELASASKAGMLVTGTVSRDRDSLRFNAQIIRVSDGSVVEQVPPVKFSPSDPSRAIERLSQQVVGVFAAFGDDRFRAWTSGSKLPRYDAYQEFAAGLDADARGDTGSTRHFINAAHLDTTFAEAKLKAVADDGSDASFARSDSLLHAAKAQNERQTPYDNAALDEAFAVHRGDWESAYLAAQRMVELAPSSRNAHLRLINDAMGTMRYADAMREYDVLGRSGWIVNWNDFWRGELIAHHVAGDYVGELHAARTAAGQNLRDANVCALQIPPLAALGKFAELDSTLVACESLPNALEPSFRELSAGRELFAHGYRDAATRAFERGLQRLPANTRARADSAASIAMYLGNWRPSLAITAVRLALDTTDVTNDGRYGVAAAHLGDTATARAMERRIASLQSRAAIGQTQLWQGFIAAALGERERATELLRSAVKHGASPAFFLHSNAAYIEPLRGYAPFEALKRR